MWSTMRSAVPFLFFFVSASLTQAFHVPHHSQWKGLQLKGGDILPAGRSSPLHAVVPTEATVEMPARRGGGLDLELVARSSVAAASGLTTWLIVQHTSLSAVQASSLHGLFAALALPTPFATAVFCGSFAGMSSIIRNGLDASLLGLVCAVMYGLWERGNKIQPGRGGRLGAISFISNFLLVGMLSRGVLASAMQEIAGTLGVTTTLLMSISTVLALFVRQMRKTKETLDETSRKHTAVSIAAGGLLGASLLFRLVHLHGFEVFQKFLPTAVSVLVAATIVKRAQVGVVLPPALVGLGGSFCGDLAAPIYMGSFIGMTGLPWFQSRSLIVSSIFATALFLLAPFQGYGGRLGLMAFLGVKFAGLFRR